MNLVRLKNSIGMSFQVFLLVLLLLLVWVNSPRIKPPKWPTGLLICGLISPRTTFIRTILVVSFKVYYSKNLSSRLIPWEPSYKRISPKSNKESLLLVLPMLTLVTSKDSMKPYLTLTSLKPLCALLLSPVSSLTKSSRVTLTSMVVSSVVLMFMVLLKDAKNSLTMNLKLPLMSLWFLPRSSTKMFPTTCILSRLVLSLIKLKTSITLVELYLKLKKLIPPSTGVILSDLLRSYLMPISLSTSTTTKFCLWSLKVTLKVRLPSKLT